MPGISGRKCVGRGDQEKNPRPGLSCWVLEKDCLGLPRVSVGGEELLCLPMVPMLLCGPRSRRCSEAAAAAQITCLIREAEGQLWVWGFKDKKVRAGRRQRGRT